MFCVFKSIFCKSFFHGSAFKFAKICLIKIFDLLIYILQHLKQFDSVSVYILLLLSWWLTPRERLPVVVFPPERFLVEILTLKFSEIFFAVLTCLWQRNVKHVFYIFVYDVCTYISLKFKSRISESHFWLHHKLMEIDTSMLQDRYLFLCPTQYFPPCLGLHIK